MPTSVESHSLGKDGSPFLKKRAGKYSQKVGDRMVENDIIYDGYTGEFMSVKDFADRYRLSVDFVLNMKKKGWTSEEIRLKEKREDMLVRCFG